MPKKPFNTKQISKLCEAEILLSMEKTPNNGHRFRIPNITDTFSRE